jgi:type IV fimbrial biogenesis protein FimT
MMISPTGNPRNANPGCCQAFTLIELILVMALLTVVIGLASPALSRFFRGRSLDTEAGRFLALTRYGQSRAVSSGLPMVLWIDRTEGEYGLREEDGFGPDAGQVRIGTGRDTNDQEDKKPMEYQLAKDLNFDIDNNERITNGLAAIHFSPDGSIDETSLKLVFIRGRDNAVIPIVQSRNRLHYEIGDRTNGWDGALR